MSSVVEAAAGYARRGWKVFPCHTARAGVCSCNKADCRSPGKHPRTSGGLKDASSEPSRVADWWQMWPDANVAIVTGEASGLIVLDLDGPEAVAEIKRMEAQFGPLPATVMARTGKGEHWYFNMPHGG